MKSLVLSLSLMACCLFSVDTLGAQEKKKGNPEKMFARIDANSDKNVSFEEFKSMKRKNDVAEEKLEKQFKKMDANSDGMIDYAEFLAAREKRMKKQSNR